GGCARPHPPRARHDRVVEGEAARRTHRRESERRGTAERVRLLGAPAARPPGLDAAALVGGRRVPRRAAVHDGRRPRPHPPPRRPLRRRPLDAATARTGPPRSPLNLAESATSGSSYRTWPLSTSATARASTSARSSSTRPPTSARTSEASANEKSS